MCEGAMGFYDGQGLTTRASAWELADALDLPVLLVVQPKGASVTLAAEIQGLVHFKPESHIAGILLNDCSEKLFRMLKPLLETETGLPVLGYLPRLPQAVVEAEKQIWPKPAPRILPRSRMPLQWLKHCCKKCVRRRLSLCKIT